MAEETTPITQPATKLTGTQTFFMVLMPTSQFVQWVWTIATFIASSSADEQTATNTIRTTKRADRAVAERRAPAHTSFLSLACPTLSYRRPTPRWPALSHAFRSPLPSPSQVLPLAGMSAFFTAWAIRNKLGPNPKEKAMFTFPLGIAAYVLYLLVSPSAGYIMSAIVCLVMTVNYAVPAFTARAVEGGYLGASSLLIARTKGMTMLWARCVKVQFVSALIFWPCCIALNIAELNR
mmetsp:Transcript_109907/g.319838  ORF Transcript_109907/g.319838 Transcript_109907/m.319838 type:complete len:236 (-) Transcript_109907:214-921(-)